MLIWSASTSPITLHSNWIHRRHTPIAPTLRQYPVRFLALRMLVLKQRDLCHDTGHFRMAPRELQWPLTGLRRKKVLV
jgi:hypothetical protein